MSFYSTNPKQEHRKKYIFIKITYFHINQPWKQEHDTNDKTHLYMYLF